MRRAAFLDRDGTIIEERNYIADPADVALLPGAAQALRELAGAGFLLIVVTNQSGLARGLISAAQYTAVQQRVESLLSGEGVVLDAVYFCPHHPEFTGGCECRKPGLGMYRAAAARFGIDLGASLYIGDRPGDVEPALATGGRGVLVRTGYGGVVERVPAGVETAADLLEGVRIVLTRVG